MGRSSRTGETSEIRGLEAGRSFVERWDNRCMDFNVHGDNNVYMGNCPNSNTQMLGAGQELHVDITYH